MTTNHIHSLSIFIRRFWMRWESPRTITAYIESTIGLRSFRLIPGRWSERFLFDLIQTLNLFLIFFQMVLFKKFSLKLLFLWNLSVYSRLVLSVHRLQSFFFLTQDIKLFQTLILQLKLVVWLYPWYYPGMFFESLVKP